MNKFNFKSLVAVLLTVLMVFSILPVTVSAAETTATKVTDIANLAVGDQVILVNQDGTHAMGVQSGTKRDIVACEATDGSVTVSGAMAVLTVEAGTQAGTFALKASDGYIGFNNGVTKNQVHTIATLNDDASWTITIADGVATIINVGTSARYLQYNINANQERFACYKNTLQDPVIYKIEAAEAPACEHKNTEVVGAKDATETEEGYTGDTVCKDCGTVVAAGEKIPVIVNDPAADSTLTIVEALALGASKAHNTYTAGKYYVVGEITEVYNTQYGNMKIKDAEGNILTIYGTYSADGSTRYDSLEVKPVAGDTVKIYGIVGQFNGTAQIKNGWIVEHTPAVCEHANTEIVGAKEATETEEGYTGDKVCTKCGETVEQGTTIPVKAPETVEPAPTGDGMIVVVAAVLLAGAAIALISRKRRFN